MKKVSEQTLEAREARAHRHKKRWDVSANKGVEKVGVGAVSAGRKPAERPEKPEPRRGSRRPPQRRPLLKAL